MNWLVVLPLVIPLLGAAVSLIARGRAFQRGIALAGAALLLAANLGILAVVLCQGVLCVQVGNWEAPFGITLVADRFSAIMLAVAGIVALAGTLYALGTLDGGRERFGAYPLLQLLWAGVCGAFLAGDLFNLFVWFEVMLIASYVLMALGGQRSQLEGGLKYLGVNLVASALFLSAVGIVYGMAGTLNMAHLAVRLPVAGPPGLLSAAAMLFLSAFGIKAAVFPFFFWLPASYHTPPAAVSAVLAGLLTKVGVYALIRTFTLVAVQDVGYTHSLILIVAALTMVTGVLGALAQHEFRRVLSFHIISQIGYMILGLGLFSPLALAGAIFYIVHHILVKTCLFFVSGLAWRLRGTYELERLGGFYGTHPGLCAVFAVPALSLAGLPPLSGFFAKLVLVQASLEMGHYMLALVALGVSLLTLYSMSKIWTLAFWQPAADTPQSPRIAPHRSRGWLLAGAPAVVFAGLSIALGLGAGPFLEVCRQAAGQLLDPQEYIAAVLASGGYACS